MCKNLSIMFSIKFVVEPIKKKICYPASQEAGFLLIKLFQKLNSS
jgi:hypothetical protein